MFELIFLTDPVVKAMTTRKEGADRDILAVDVKIQGTVKGECLSSLLGASAGEISVFWRGVEDSPATFTGITSIKSWAKHDNCTTSIGGVKFEGVTAKKFQIAPAAGKTAEVTFQIGISNIPTSDVGRLADMVNEHVKVEIRGEEDLFDDAGEAA